jgi:hypothetical protein
VDEFMKPRGQWPEKSLGTTAVDQRLQYSLFCKSLKLIPGDIILSDLTLMSANLVVYYCLSSSARLLS